MRYRWQFWPNDAMATLHLSVPVPSFGSVLGPPDGPGVVLKEAIEGVDGIEEAFAHNRYRITITRGLAFEWGDIQAEVFKVVAGRLGFAAEDAWRMDDIEAMQETPGEAMDYDC
jgi:hypothetical protein